MQTYQRPVSLNDLVLPPPPPRHPVAVLSSQLVVPPLILPSTKPDMPPEKSIVYSLGPFPPYPLFTPVIDLCANIEPRRRGRERKWERADETVQEKRKEWEKENEQGTGGRERERF